MNVWDALPVKWLASRSMGLALAREWSGFLRGLLFLNHYFVTIVTAPPVPCPVRKMRSPLIRRQRLFWLMKINVMAAVQWRASPELKNRKLLCVRWDAPPISMSRDL